jgi:hypothetical protein
VLGASPVTIFKRGIVPEWNLKIIPDARKRTMIQFLEEENEAVPKFAGFEK